MLVDWGLYEGRSANNPTRILEKLHREVRRNTEVEFCDDVDGVLLVKHCLHLRFICRCLLPRLSLWHVIYPEILRALLVSGCGPAECTPSQSTEAVGDFCSDNTANPSLYFVCPDLVSVRMFLKRFCKGASVRMVAPIGFAAKGMV
jgi:hypothetical protein